MVDLQDALEECGSRKKNIEEAHLSSQRIYKILVYFDKLYDTMSDEDKQLFFKSLIKEIRIHEEPIGKQWIKSIKFTFPVLGEVDEIGLDNENTVETVCLLGRRKPDDTIKVSVNMDDYYQIRDAEEAEKTPS